MPLLRDYEILYIVRPELDEEQVNGAVETVNTLITSLGGAAQATNVWGKRRLAYEVAHLREGHYILTDFQIEPARVPEMEATLKISETVFRHLIVRKPEKAAAPAAATAEKSGAPAQAPAEPAQPTAAAEEPEAETPEAESEEE